MSDRKIILDANHAVRDKRLPTPRRLDEGEVVFRIPKGDMKVLARIYPELLSKQHDVRLAAWKKLRNSPIGEKYLVTKTPRQVKRGQKGIIIK